MIEIIEKFTDNFKGNKESYSAQCTQISDELCFSKKLITEEQSIQRSTLSDENHTGKSENLSAQLPKRFNKLPNKLLHMMLKSLKNSYYLIKSFF